jgi:hypothetical protein
MKTLNKPQSNRSAAVLAAILVVASTPCFGQATYLWAADYNSGTVYKHDAAGALILTWETDFFGHPTGIAFDGTNLLIGDSFEAYNRIYKYSRHGVQLSYIDLNTVGLAKVRNFEKKVLAWDGEFLWYSSSARFEVYKIRINAWAATPGSIDIVASFPVPGSSPTGLEWDGRSIWLVDNLNNFYQLDASGKVLGSFNYSQEVSDLAWDGRHLWAHGGGFDGGTFKLDQLGNTLSELDIYYWPGSGAAWELVPGPEIIVQQPLNTDIPNGGGRSVAAAAGTEANLTFIIKNTGLGNLTGLEITLAQDAALFAITASPSAPVSGPTGSTSFTVRFSPDGVGMRTATLHIASNDVDENPFDIALTGRGLSPLEDTDGDGLNDAAEYRWASLGFDWQVNQAVLVNTLFMHSNTAGLFTTAQIGALRPEATLLTEDPLSGLFKLTIGVEQSADLTRFTPFPLSQVETTLNAQGKLEFKFSAPDSTRAFFRLVSP